MRDTGAVAVTPSDDGVAFASFVAAVEPILRRALVAAYGAELGREATADALAWAWQHWSRVRGMKNPAGYLWRVGQTAVRSATRRRRRERHGLVVIDSRADPRGADAAPVVEPALAAALGDLSPQQRAAVVLVHGYGCTLAEAAESLGCSVSTVRNHVARALRHLRASLEVTDV